MTRPWLVEFHYMRDTSHFFPLPLRKTSAQRRALTHSWQDRLRSQLLFLVDLFQTMSTNRVCLDVRAFGKTISEKMHLVTGRQLKYKVQGFLYNISDVNIPGSFLDCLHLGQWCQWVRKVCAWFRGRTWGSWAYDFGPDGLEAIHDESESTDKITESANQDIGNHCILMASEVCHSTNRISTTKAKPQINK